MHVQNNNTGITDKQGFQHTSYVATATQNSMDKFTYYGNIKKRKENVGFWMIFGLIVSI